MSKKLLIFLGTFLILLSFNTLYYAYTPKVGPIGNGMNGKLVWLQFKASFIAGICSLLRGLLITKEEIKEEKRTFHKVLLSFNTYS